MRSRMRPEFISFITSEASERCLNEKRKTINGEDILWAMQTLGFDAYVEPLKIYLSKYRLSAKGDRQSAAASISADFGAEILMGAEADAGVGLDSSSSSQTGAAGVYEDIVLEQSTGQRQVRLATNADGQLTIIEMPGDASGNIMDANDGGAITLLSGNSNGANGAQQFILTTLDQSGIGGGHGVQQFAQLAFLPGGGNGASGATAQGIPVVFLDSGGSGGQQTPQYITMNPGGGGGLQIIHVAQSSMMGGGADAGADMQQQRAGTSGNNEGH